MEPEEEREVIYLSSSSDSSASSERRRQRVEEVESEDVREDSDYAPSEQMSEEAIEELEEEEEREEGPEIVERKGTMSPYISRAQEQENLKFLDIERDRFLAKARDLFPELEHGISPGQGFENPLFMMARKMAKWVREYLHDNFLANDLFREQLAYLTHKTGKTWQDVVERAYRHVVILLEHYQSMARISAFRALPEKREEEMDELEEHYGTARMKDLAGTQVHERLTKLFVSHLIELVWDRSFERSILDLSYRDPGPGIPRRLFTVGHLGGLGLHPRRGGGPETRVQRMRDYLAEYYQFVVARAKPLGRVKARDDILESSSDED